MRPPTRSCSSSRRSSTRRRTLTPAELAEFEALINAKTHYARDVDVHTRLRRQGITPSAELEQALADAKLQRARLRQLAQLAAARAGALTSAEDNGQSLWTDEEYAALKRAAAADPRSVGAGERARLERRRQEQLHQRRQQQQQQRRQGQEGSGSGSNTVSGEEPPEQQQQQQLSAEAVAEKTPAKSSGAKATARYRARQKAAGRVIHEQIITYYMTLRVGRARLAAAAGSDAPVKLRQFLELKRDEQRYVQLNNVRRELRRTDHDVPQEMQEEIERCLASTRELARLARQWAIEDGVLTPEGAVVPEAWYRMHGGPVIANVEPTAEERDQDESAESELPAGGESSPIVPSQPQPPSPSPAEPDSTLFQAKRGTL